MKHVLSAAAWILAANINALLALIGFVAVVTGVGLQFSWPIASIVAGVVLMGLGSWPYVVLPKRKP